MRLEEEKAKLEEEKAKLEEESQETGEQEPIIKETIIKDEEELNKLKYKNLMRMNTRLSRIIRDTEKLQIQKETKSKLFRVKITVLLKYQKACSL